MNESSIRRRALLQGSVVAPIAVVLMPDSAVALPVVQPLSAEAVRQGWRVCDHQNFPGAYEARTSCIEMADSAHYPGVRGMLVANAEGLATAEALRVAGMKWCATLKSATAGTTDTVVRNKIAWIAENAADVVTEIEGINEWDNESSMDAAAEVAFQRLVKAELAKYDNLSHVRQVGGACHDLRVKERAGIEYKQLMAVNNGEYADLIHDQAVHAYPKGRDIDFEFARRVNYIRSAGITKPLVVTETGWQNPGTSAGGAKVSEAQAADLAQRAVLLSTRLRSQYKVRWWSRYELLRTDTGSDNWGVVDASTTDDPNLGRKKPEYTSTQLLLGALHDPGAENFVPEPIELSVVGNAEWFVTGKTDGTYILHLWAATDGTVTVSDAGGTRTEPVGYRPRHVPCGTLPPVATSPGA